MRIAPRLRGDLGLFLYDHFHIRLIKIAVAVTPPWPRTLCECKPLTEEPSAEF